MSTFSSVSFRRFIVLVATVALSSRSMPAADVPPPPAQLDDSIARALDYLAKQQNPDGSFGTVRAAETKPATAPATAPATPLPPPLAITGLTLMAFLATGNAPDVGRHGLVVRNAIDHLVAKVPEDGYIGAIKGDKGDDSRMYGQGIVTLALAEAYGLENDRGRRVVLRAVISKMIAVILAAQAIEKSEVHAGGWRYTPDAPDSDLSLTGWNALALRACHEAGFNVPKEAVQRAAQYVLKCRNPLDKGFAYQPGAPGQAGTTGIAILTLHLLDASTRPEVADAKEFLARAGAQPPPRYPYYSMYYTVQASLQAGEPAWSACSKPIFDALLKSQTPDGGWPVSATPEEPGRVYATAMAVLTLSAPYRLLPVYQK